LAALFVVGAGALWAWLPHRPRVPSRLSSRDVAEIKSLMHQYAGGNLTSARFALSPQGFASLPQLVQEIIHYRPARVLRIEADGEGARAEATVRTLRSYKIGTGVTCKLDRITNAWVITSSRVWIGP
jgi:hypothetical protein